MIRVVCALSGGVDSAVAAYLLKSKGYDVTAVFMKNWDHSHDQEVASCSYTADLMDAMWCADQLSITLHQANFVSEYWNSVFVHVIQAIEHGLTPNADVLCNQYVKFGCLFDWLAKYHEDQSDFVATGHYARGNNDPLLGIGRLGKSRLFIPKDYVKVRANPPDNLFYISYESFKDQTLFLSRIKQNVLNRTLFPLEGLYKHQVIDIANSIGLGRLARRRSSSGMCFVEPKKFTKFLENYVTPRCGKVVDYVTKQVISDHKGLQFYTVGQQARIGGQKYKYYVHSKCIESGVLFVVPNWNHFALYSDEVLGTNVHWIADDPIAVGSRFQCQFRFQHMTRLIDCRVEIQKGQKLSVRIKLNQPLRALTPGQTCALYLKDECIGAIDILSVGSSLFDQNKQLTLYDNLFLSYDRLH